MKKLLAVLLAGVMACSFMACGGSGNETTTTAATEVLEDVTIYAFIAASLKMQLAGNR